MTKGCYSRDELICLLSIGLTDSEYLRMFWTNMLMTNRIKDLGQAKAQDSHAVYLARSMTTILEICAHHSKFYDCPPIAGYEHISRENTRRMLSRFGGRFSPSVFNVGQIRDLLGWLKRVGSGGAGSYLNIGNQSVSDRIAHVLGSKIESIKWTDSMSRLSRYGSRMFKKCKPNLYPDREFDIITMFDVLQTSENPVALVRRLTMTAKIGAFLILRVNEAPATAYNLGLLKTYILMQDTLYIRHPIEKVIRHYIGRCMSSQETDKLFDQFGWNLIFKVDLCTVNPLQTVIRIYRLMNTPA